MTTLHWLALTLTPGIGGVTARKLLHRFGDVESIFTASQEQLVEIPRVTPEIARRLLAISFEQMEMELLSLDEEGIEVLAWDDERFPHRLRKINDVPLVLFVRGAILPKDERAVAIVGTRQPMPASVNWAENLSLEMAHRGWTVVSGLAEGVDTAAHTGALSAGRGRTLAVLGSGIRVIHPRSNSGLAEQIIARGALVSEYHPNTPARGPQLMARDRIVSGLSRAVIVVEAAVNSGSLDTAARAKKQGRGVYAIPGSAGTEALIQSGAYPLYPDSIDFDELVADLDRYVSPDEPPKPVQGRLF